MFSCYLYSSNDLCCCCECLQIVERVRAGTGKGKRLLVVDIETEEEMKERGEEITMEAAIVMVPRQPQEEIIPPRAPVHLC